MRPKALHLAAIIGSALFALSLSGSTWRMAGDNSNRLLSVEVSREGGRLYAARQYSMAREAFRRTALIAERDKDPRKAAANWNNAGASSFVMMQFRDALTEFLRASKASDALADPQIKGSTLNNLAGLYMQMGNSEAGAQIARQALAVPPGQLDPSIRSKLQYQLAQSLANLGKMDEASPLYLEAVAGAEDRNELETAARLLAAWGSACLRANRLDAAESVLTEALRLVRTHRLSAVLVNVLRGLARLKAQRGDQRSAATLFQAALDAPPGTFPRWTIFAERGDARYRWGDLRGALEDFREGRRLADLMKADAVPADHDRVALQNGLNRLAAGFVDAGNRLARTTSARGLFEETFEAAEQDRLWSLRALVPTPNDWRTRLPGSYWDLLARYQAVERTTLAQPSPELSKQASALRLSLQQIEAAAASDGTGASPQGFGNLQESALGHVRRILDADTVLLSFHITEASGWLWAVDRRGVEVYPVPPLGRLKSAVDEFARATRLGGANAAELGRQLYRDLFGELPAAHLTRKRWLLELDGPLFDLPFAALVVDHGRQPTYLIERVALQVIPGALMLEARTVAADGDFLGIGDPVYNAADVRYRGNRKKQEVVLPRLAATADELTACSRAWNPARSQLLTGEMAGLQNVRQALRSNPSVIHFATHVITAPGDYSSGLIALSLDRSGAIGLLGPTEILAHPLTPGLVVLNGCHSAQGEAVPGAGLMGLTRAWIGAGARAVLATKWDIPDHGGKTIMVEFYRRLKENPEKGPAFALRQAQLAMLASTEMAKTPEIWGAYFVLGRE